MACHVGAVIERFQKTSEDESLSAFPSPNGRGTPLAHLYRKRFKAFPRIKFSIDAGNAMETESALTLYTCSSRL